MPLISPVQYAFLRRVLFSLHSFSVCIILHYFNVLLKYDDVLYVPYLTCFNLFIGLKFQLTMLDIAEE